MASTLRSFLVGILLLALTGLLAPHASAQDVVDNLGEIGEEYATGYTQPFTNAFGTNLNSGLFHSADLGGFFPMVNVYVGVKAMGAFVPGEDETFSLTLNEGETVSLPGRDEQVNVAETRTFDDLPTVFGTSDIEPINVPVATEAGEEEIEIEPLPGVTQPPAVPLMAPQVGVGTLFGTDLVVRYLPSGILSPSSYGSFGLTGVGVRHDVNQYLPPIPVSFAAQLTWQSLDIEDNAGNDVFTSTNWAASLIASRSFMVVTVYGGLQAERASFDVTYDLTLPDGSTERIDLNLTGDNRFRALLGASLNLGLVVVNTDVSIGRQTAISAGVGLQL